jgi:hypothetical protein
MVIDTIEALGVTAGVIVDLQLIVAAGIELVSHLAYGDAIEDSLLGFEMIPRELEAMVPKRVLA